MSSRLRYYRVVSCYKTLVLMTNVSCEQAVRAKADVTRSCRCNKFQPPVAELSAPVVCPMWWCMHGVEITLLLFFISHCSDVTVHWPH